VLATQTPYQTNNYTKLRSSEDISFTLHFLSLTAYCGETTFFNVFNPQALTFEVTPQLASKPQLRVHQVSDTQINIIIPKEE